uniref:Uncharacterized protein n=1 Tax=Talaromyces marneffei PM1 TaxID=1077442 RepID=A0A093URQ6_TALMA
MPTINRFLICSGLEESGGKFSTYIAPLSRNICAGKTSGREASFAFFIPNIPQTEKCGYYVDKLIEKTHAKLSFVQLDPHDTLESSKTKHVGHGSTDDTWKAMSKAIAERARPGLMRTDESLLLILLCFFNHEVSLDVLCRGASSRQRWTRQGENENTGPSSMGLAKDLQFLLSDYTRLKIAAHELEKHSTITKNYNETYTVISVIRNHIIDQLPRQLHSFWRLQALIIAYRAVPWKHLEPMLPKLKEPIMIHLKHTLQEVRDHEGFKNMSENMRVDLALTLVEASRFQKIEWKKLAVALAKEVAHGLNNRYVRYCIAARESLLYRITGDYTQAVHVIETTLDPTQHRLDIDMMAHVAAGYLQVQRAMNYFQNEQLALSLKTLDAWQPLQDTPAERAVLFHISILRGRVLRFQGKFHESLACLKKYEHFDDLLFGDELCDLTCEIADTLRELMILCMVNNCSGGNLPVKCRLCPLNCS